MKTRPPVLGTAVLCALLSVALVACSSATPPPGDRDGLGTQGADVLSGVVPGYDPVADGEYVYARVMTQGPTVGQYVFSYVAGTLAPDGEFTITLPALGSSPPFTVCSNSEEELDVAAQVSNVIVTDVATGPTITNLDWNRSGGQWHRSAGADTNYFRFYTPSKRSYEANCTVISSTFSADVVLEAGWNIVAIEHGPQTMSDGPLDAAAIWEFGP